MPPKGVIVKIGRKTEVLPSAVHEPIKIGSYTLISAETGGGYFVSALTTSMTYDIKDDLKARGCTWHRSKEMWYVKPEKLEDVRDYLTKLVKVEVANPAGAPARAVMVKAAPVVFVGAEDLLKPSEKVKTLSELMTSLGTTDARTLTTLSPAEINYLVSILTLHDGVEKLSDRVEQMKVHMLIEELGGKLCRCIKKVMIASKLEEKAAIPICISRIFVGRGLKISTFQCKDGELLLPSTGSKIVLDRQPGKTTIVKP